MTKTNLSKVSCIQFSNVDMRQSPEFEDAFISYAEYYGQPMTNEELEELNDDRDFVYDELMKFIY